MEQRASVSRTGIAALARTARKARPRVDLVRGPRIELYGALRRGAVFCNDPVPLRALDDMLRLRPHMILSRGDGEAVRVRAERLVLGDRHVDPLPARRVGAFTRPAAERGEVLERLVQLLDALVDLTEQRLVLSRPQLVVGIGLHRTALPRPAGDCAAAPTRQDLGRTKEGREPERPQ